MFGGFGTLGDGILGFTGGIGDAIVAFDEFIKTSGAFQKVGEGIATVIQTIMTALSTLKNKIKEKFESANFELFHSLLEGEVEVTRLFKYGEDFFIGDIVQIANEYGNEGSAYISELVISNSEEGLSIYPTFKTISK